jgi:DNA (cytosine-5)-methyltransferase 1
MAHAGSGQFQEQIGRPEGRDGNGSDSQESLAGALKGYWRDADWLLCTDGWWRPVEPCTFPLVDGAPGRLGRLRGYGDAINSQVAKEFIAAYIEATKQ